MAQGKHLKAWNLPWLCSVVAFDMIALYFLLFPDALASTSFTSIATARVMLSTALPVAVVLLASLLPNSVKASLVYWKIKEALPGHQAFSKYGPADSRVDMAALRKNIGIFPVGPREQNALWYKLYRKVGSEIGVMDSHKSFLLFRDMAAISALLAFIVPAAFLLADVHPVVAAWSFTLLLAQYLMAAISARNCGIRFVGTVLAEHSIKRVTQTVKGA